MDFVVGNFEVCKHFGGHGVDCASDACCDDDRAQDCPSLLVVRGAAYFQLFWLWLPT